MHREQREFADDDRHEALIVAMQRRGIRLNAQRVMGLTVQNDDIGHDFGTPPNSYCL